MLSKDKRNLRRLKRNIKPSILFSFLTAEEERKIVNFSRDNKDIITKIMAHSAFEKPEYDVGVKLILYKFLEAGDLTDIDYIEHWNDMEQIVKDTENTIVKAEKSIDKKISTGRSSDSATQRFQPTDATNTDSI